MDDSAKKLHSHLKPPTRGRTSSQPSELFEVDSKPDFCAKCNSHRILEIVYGHRDGLIPLGDEYALGSCVIDNDSPSWECRDCNAQFVAQRQQGQLDHLTEEK